MRLALTLIALLLAACGSAPTPTPTVNASLRAAATTVNNVAQPVAERLEQQPVPKEQSPKWLLVSGSHHDKRWFEVDTQSLRVETPSNKLHFDVLEYDGTSLFGNDEDATVEVSVEHVSINDCATEEAMTDAVASSAASGVGGWEAIAAARFGRNPDVIKWACGHHQSELKVVDGDQNYDLDKAAEESWKTDPNVQRWKQKQAESEAAQAVKQKQAESEAAEVANQKAREGAEESEKAIKAMNELTETK